MFRQNIIINFNFSLSGSVVAEAIFNLSAKFLLLGKLKGVDSSVQDPEVDFIIARSFQTDLCLNLLNLFKVEVLYISNIIFT